MITAVFAATGLLAAACQSSGTPTSKAGSTKAAASPAAPQAQLAISPADGSHNVKPDQGVTVTATNGKISIVTVTSQG